MKRVVIESPYAGDVERNTRYARRAMADSLQRGEAPLASHLLYTQPGILDDTVPEERKRGIQAGFVWGQLAEAVIFYTDYGVTPGMTQGYEQAVQHGIDIIVRMIGPNETKENQK